MADKTPNVQLDPFTAHAEAETTELSPQQKIDGLKHIVKQCRYGMLVTRSQEDHLHARAMHPAAYDNLHFMFIGNNASYKFDEIKANQRVNVSFIDVNTTDWASISGVAKVHNDKKLIESLWSPLIAGYFSNLEDGVHKGDKNDPRVSVIEVIPDEIRYWVATSGALGRAVEHARGAVTGKLTVPGELRTITPNEIALVEGMHSK